MRSEGFVLGFEGLAHIFTDLILRSNSTTTALVNTNRFNMYGIFTYVYHKNQQIDIFIYHAWILYTE